MKIVFLGTPEFATPFLKRLINDPDIEIAGVVCQPDKPVGRKQELSEPPVKRMAVKYSIPVFQFQTLKDQVAINTLSSLKADVFVLVVYGKILPQAVLDLAPFGVVNVHPSLLPKYRGPSPMKTAILNGDTQTGVSIMLLDEGMDTGPILAQEVINIESNETNSTLEEKVCKIGPELLITTLKAYVNKEIEPKPQNNDLASISKILDRNDGKINWNDSAVEIERKIRAFEPWPGTWSTLNGMRLKILNASISTQSISNSTVGSIFKKEDQILVQTKDGSLQLKELQIEGKQVQSIEQFLHGHPDFIGSALK